MWACWYKCLLHDGARVGKDAGCLLAVAGVTEANQSAAGKGLRDRDERKNE